MKLFFNVTKQNLTRVDNFTVVADSKNYLKAHFQFLTDEWTGTKTAIFKKGDIVKKQLLDENGECDVPWEVIKSTCFTVSVFAGDLITTGEVTVRVADSGYTEDGEFAESPTPDVYNQILERLDNMNTGAENSPLNPFENTYWRDSADGNIYLVKMSNGALDITKYEP